MIQNNLIAFFPSTSAESRVEPLKQATVSNRLRRLPTIACSDNRFPRLVLSEKIIIFVEMRMRSSMKVFFTPKCFLFRQ